MFEVYTFVAQLLLAYVLIGVFFGLSVIALGGVEMKVTKRTRLPDGEWSKGVDDSKPPVPVIILLFFAFLRTTAVHWPAMMVSMILNPKEPKGK